MKIGILGTGNIGKTLALTLSAAGHDVKVANSRGPDSIDAEILQNGARAVTADEAAEGVEVLILSIPPTSFGKVAAITRKVPADVTLIDTSNYYPMRDGHIDAIDAGQIEGIWSSEQLGHPIVKAWNAIGSDSFEKEGLPEGAEGRIAIPVAGDNPRDREIAIALVGDTGFDGYDAGTLSESWRQQPGSPGYCTDLGRDELKAALAAADRDRMPKRRDIAMQAVMERMNDTKDGSKAEFLVPLNRLLYM